MNAQLFEAVKRFHLSNGQQVPPQDLIRVTRARYFHRREYPTGGSAQLSFFNDSPNEFISNWPSSNGLQNDQFFILSSLRVKVQTGIVLATGARVAGGAQIAGGATATGPTTQAEEIRTIMQNALARLNIGNVKVAEVFGLDSLPGGGGLVFNVGLSNVDSDLAAGRQDSVIAVNNGEANANNAFVLPRYGVVPGRQVKLDIKWPALLTATTAPIIMAEMDGTLFELATT